MNPEKSGASRAFHLIQHRSAEASDLCRLFLRLYNCTQQGPNLCPLFRRLCAIRSHRGPDLYPLFRRLCTLLVQGRESKPSAGKHTKTPKANHTKHQRATMPSAKGAQYTSLGRSPRSYDTPMHRGLKARPIIRRRPESRPMPFVSKTLHTFGTGRAYQRQN
jgi:hypothetical protein